MQPVELDDEAIEIIETAAAQGRCPRPESNQRTRFRKPLLYPLSYGGAGTLCRGAGSPAPPLVAP
jgi:hypothetical protein